MEWEQGKRGTEQRKRGNDGKGSKGGDERKGVGRNGSRERRKKRGKEGGREWDFGRGEKEEEGLDG